MKTAWRIVKAFVFAVGLIALWGYFLAMYAYACGDGSYPPAPEPVTVKVIAL